MTTQRGRPRLRIALVSDSHIRNGQPPLPRTLVEALASADMILHAGDIADASGLAAFKAIGPEVVAVGGNLDTAALVADLPEMRYVETPAGTIALMHILPATFSRPRRAAEFFLGKCEQALAVVYGHTHCPDVQQVTLRRRTVWIVNPGSVTRSRGWGHTFAWLEVSDDGGAASVRIETLD